MAKLEGESAIERVRTIESENDRKVRENESESERSRFDLKMSARTSWLIKHTFQLLFIIWPVKRGDGEAAMVTRRNRRRINFKLIGRISGDPGRHSPGNRVTR